MPEPFNEEAIDVIEVWLADEFTNIDDPDVMLADLACEAAGLGDGEFDGEREHVAMSLLASNQITDPAEVPRLDDQED